MKLEIDINKNNKTHFLSFIYPKYFVLPLILKLTP